MSIQLRLRAIACLNCRSTSSDLLCNHSFLVRFSSLKGSTSHDGQSPYFCSSQWFYLLREAVAASDLRLGKSLHALVLRFYQGPDLLLANNLINLYSKCRVPVNARKVFDGMHDRDVISWNSMLSAYALSEVLDDDSCEKGMRLFRDFLRTGALGNQLTLAPVLTFYSWTGHGWDAECVHGYAVKIGLLQEVFVCGGLVNVYAKLGKMKEARILFDGMVERDAVLWNMMIKGCLNAGLGKEGYLLFVECHRSGLCLDGVSLRYVLDGFDLIDSDEGNREFEQVLVCGIKSGICNDGYDVYKWNKRLSVDNANGNFNDVVECFKAMIRLNIGYDGVSLVVVLSALTSMNDICMGQQVHGAALKSGLGLDVSVGNCLINVYSKAGCTKAAKLLFDEMKEVDLVSWNSIISSCSQNNLGNDSLGYFICLLRSGLLPDSFTLGSILKALSSLEEDIEVTRQVHVLAIKAGIASENFVTTALIDNYSREGMMKESENLFRNEICFDLASLNAMMFGYIICGDSNRALELFSRLHEDGVKADGIVLATLAKACGCLRDLERVKQLHAYSIRNGFDLDVCVCSGILDLYIRCGEMESAIAVFQGIQIPDYVAWTTMISGCVENGEAARAVSLYHQMRLSGIVPDEFILATLAKAASCLTAIEPGKQIHANIMKFNCSYDSYVRTSLIDMYAKCGNIQDAYNLFKTMDLKNVAAWNAMLVGMAQHGDAIDALGLLEDMKRLDIKPDKVTFVGALSACSHSGLVTEAWEIFGSMKNIYCIEPEVEHYSCLVDALGRAGCILEAEKLISEMPFEPSASMLRTLLSACRFKGDVETGKRIASRLLALEPHDTSAFVLLSNIYVSVDSWDDMKDARDLMKKDKLKKDPGFSWVDV
ncbi:hypothetical protein MLD38_015119 [Melastoma candidum]|uniref:Uncharacterized protein n=1 Tax=Melastoma candidum TaxID=119954 RepID=A0ACB9RJ97_9MYRT|nr:hypothetical protein MLD38_015119 [Melastoma candidum]